MTVPRGRQQTITISSTTAVRSVWCPSRRWPDLVCISYTLGSKAIGSRYGNQTLICDAEIKYVRRRSIVGAESIWQCMLVRWVGRRYVSP